MLAEERRRYIGGSDFTNILSLEPYGCRRKAWFSKRGELPEIETTNDMKRGTRGEDLAVEEYEEQTGRSVRRRKIILNADDPQFAANIDRHIVAFDERGPGVLEVKCPSSFAFRRVKSEGLHQGYIAQINWYLYITGWKWGSYAIFNLDRWELLWWDVERDQALIDLLVAEAHSFWAAVENGPMPEALDASDKRCIKCPMRARCHGEEPMPEYAGDVQTDNSLAPLMGEYAEAKAIFDDAEELLDGTKERIKAAMADRACVDTAGGRIYFASQSRTSIDAKGLRAKHPEIAAQFEKVSKFRSLRIFEKGRV